MARILSTQTGQPGGAMALEGGFIQAKSSGPDVVTIQAHSSQAGDLLNLSTYKASSTDASGEVVSISASGAGTWAETQTFSKAVSVSKGFLYPCVKIASGSTAYTVLSSNSGKIHIVPGFSSAAALTMPAVSSGLYYKFYIKAVTSSDGLSIKLPSSPGVIAHGAVIDGATIVAATAADLVGGSAIEMYSDGTLWYMSFSPPGATATELITVAAT